MPSCTDRRRWSPVLGGALLLGELCLLGLSLFHPRVDRYYRSYYIDAARPCWLQDWQADTARTKLRVETIKIAALGANDGCFLLDGGWSRIEPWGVWSNGRIARLDLPVPVVGGRHRLEITLIGFSPHDRQSVAISLNGKPAGRYFVSSKRPSTLALAIPADAAGDLTISFRIKHPASPSFLNLGNDQRRLGIGLIALNWK